MKCLFCDAEESCFVELLAWDYQRQRARELLLQGVCMMHASDTPAHPNDPSVRILHPYLQERTPKLIALHSSQFGSKTALLGALSLNLRFGQRFFPLDSPEGAMVRAARGHHVDTSVAKVGGPVDEIVVERVPTVEALLETVRGQAAR